MNDIVCGSIGLSSTTIITDGFCLGHIKTENQKFYAWFGLSRCFLSHH